MTTPAAELIILLSIGSFQAIAPGYSKDSSPVFKDSPQGLVEFTAWSKKTLKEPKFAQPPSRLCVVGAVHFTPAQAPYIPKPLWESQNPVRALEPYSAVFHYVDAAEGSKKAKPRSLKQAISICTQKEAKK